MVEIQENPVERIKEIVDICESKAISISNKANEIEELLSKIEEEETRIQVSRFLKTAVRKEACRALSEQNNWGICIMATGAGKSWVGINKIEALFNHNPNARVLLVVPTTQLRDVMWKKEFKAYGREDLFYKIERVCYKSLKNFIGEEFDFVIFDEGHNISINNFTFFNYNNVKHCVFLTATMPRDSHKKLFFRQKGLKVVYNLNLRKCIKLGLVSPYEIDLVEVDLDKVRRMEYKSNYTFKKMFGTEYSIYGEINKIYSRNKTKFNALMRSNFIYNLNSKELAAKEILENLPEDLRTIIFCGSIKQAENICSKSFHSQTDTTHLDDFNNKKINKLSCVKSLNEGHNLSELDCAIVVQVSSNELDLIQRIGRTIRYRPDFKGRIIILYAKGTVDKKWVQECIKNLEVPIRSHTLNNFLNFLKQERYGN